MVRLTELREETAQTIVDFNALLATTIAGLNERLGGATRILVKQLVP